MMIENIPFATDEKDAPEPPLGLITPPILGGPGELEAAERAFRMCEAPGHNRVIFDDGDDEDETKVVFANAADWQRLMSWSRLPTIEEAHAWRAWATAVEGAEMFFAIEAARAVTAPPVAPARPAAPETAEEPGTAPARPRGYKMA